MRRQILLVAVLFAAAGCASTTHVRSAIGSVAPLSVNLSAWKYVRTYRSVQQRWGRIGPPLWIHPTEDGGQEAIGVLVEPGGFSGSTDFGLYTYRPGRTHLVAVSFGPDGRLRHPTAQVRRDLEVMIRVLRRQAW